MKISLVGVGVVLVFMIHELKAQNIDQIGKKGGVTLSGGASMNNVYQASNSPNSYMVPYTYILSGNITANVYGMSFPVSFSYSNRKFGYQQPFNIVGLSPRYKWITVHGGYRSMTFGQYSLSGYTFLGGGIEMKPPNSNVDISAMGGRLAKASSYDSTNGSKLPCYTRWGTGIKVKVTGKKQTFGIVCFYAKDVLNSLVVPLDMVGITPQENMVWTADLSKTLAKNLNFTGEFAASGLTEDSRNLGDAKDKAGLRSIFFINKNATTRYYKAYKASLAYVFNPVTIGISHEHIDPGYSTLGAFYFNNDIESYALNLGTKMFKGKITLAGSTGLQRDNLNKAKISTSKRWANSLNAGMTIGKRTSVNLAYSNFQSITNIRPVFLDPNVGNKFIPPDTLNYVQLTNSLTGAAAINLTKNKEKPTSISLSVARQSTSERKGTNDKIIPGSKIYNGSLSCNFKMNKNAPMVGLAIGSNLIDAPAAKTLMIGPGINMSKGYWKDKIRGSLGANASRSYIDGVSGGTSVNYNLSISCSPGKSHSISFSSVWTQRTTDVNQEKVVNRNFSASLTYSYNFSALGKKDASK